jgi:hypothetical protein
MNIKLYCNQGSGQERYEIMGVPPRLLRNPPKKTICPAVNVMPGRYALIY